VGQEKSTGLRPISLDTSAKKWEQLRPLQSQTTALPLLSYPLNWPINNLDAKQMLMLLLHSFVFSQYSCQDKVCTATPKPSNENFNEAPRVTRLFYGCYSYPISVSICHEPLLSTALWVGTWLSGNAPSQINIDVLLHARLSCAGT